MGCLCHVTSTYALYYAYVRMIDMTVAAVTVDEKMMCDRYSKLSCLF